MPVVHIGPRTRIRSRPVALAMTLVLALLSGVIGCTNLKDAQPPAAHPLLGKIWDVKRGAEISKDALLREAGTAQYLLLGEVHDNPEHHRHQAEVLRALIAQGRRPALAMEQFDREYQPAIDAVLAQPGAASKSSAEAIADAGKFDRKGWDWPLYEPLLAIAAQARLPIVAINLSRNRTRDVARQGFASLGEGAVAVGDRAAGGGVDGFAGAQDIRSGGGRDLRTAVGGAILSDARDRKARPVDRFCSPSGVVARARHLLEIP